MSLQNMLNRLVEKQAFFKKRNDFTRKGYVLKVHKI